MKFGFRLFCLGILSLCHESFPSRHWLIQEVPKRAGLDRNDPVEVQVMFNGNDPLKGNQNMNGQLFRISKRKEQDRFIPDIERQYHCFLLRYYTGCF